MRPRLDPELGVVASAKKDDDLYVKGGKAQEGWRAKGTPRIPPRKTIKRLGLLCLVVVAAYVFIRNIPTDLGPQDRNRHPLYTYPNPSVPLGGAPKTGPPIPNEAPNEGQGAVLAARNYDGPVRFLELAETLHAISATKGTAQINKNVLFMASSLSSADILLPVACQMGRELRSYVHFALVARTEIPLKQLRDINGIGEDCQIIFHDARPEFSSISTDDRFAKSVARALYHINNYMHPQAVLVDSSEAEEPLFLQTLRQQVVKLGLPTALVELPAHAEERIAWVAKLDAASLLQWNRVSVDILIHAHTDASGSLIRLLKSLSAADFTACAPPRITIELPEKIDPPTSQFLANFQWPPRSARSPTSANQLTLRHRISRRGLSEEESSVRFLESFWPANPLFSHVLVLSPQVELSPNFFHYLKMAILEYRYSSHALTQAWDKRLFGISLDLPSTHLSGSGPFTPPVGVHTSAGSPLSDASTSFLWQSPNSNAVLITGEKWAELHGLVSRVLELQHSSNTLPALLTEKMVSKDYPAWMEHVLRLCRARGYWTLYPSPGLATNLASIHSELYHQPEEYEDDGQSMRHNDEDEVVMHREPLLDSLPNKGHLFRFHEMPLLSWDGSKTTLEDLDTSAIAYASEFRRTVGGCDGAIATPLDAPLFCTSDGGI